MGQKSVLQLVLLSSGVSPYSGWGRFTQEFCCALWQKGVPFELHLPQAAEVPEVPFREAIRLDLPPWHTALGRAPWRLGALRWSAYKLARELPQKFITSPSPIIHALVEYYGLLAYWLAQDTGWPFGLTGYGTYALAPFSLPLDRFWFHRVVQAADFLVTVSHYTARQLQQASGLGPSLHVQVIHPGVSSKHLQSIIYKEEARRALSVPLDVPVLLFVGALKPRKGVDLLLRAFHQVLVHRPDALLLLVGTGDKASYQALAEKLGVERRVRFLGVVDDQMLAQCYQACDVFVLLPRRVGSAFEGFGMVYLEANAYSKPVVGANSGGAGEAIKHGETGLLVPEGDWKAAAEAILNLLQDRERAYHLGKQGRRWAEEHNWDRIVEKYLRLYTKTLTLKAPL